MKRPSLRRLLKEHRHLFHLGDMRVAVLYSGIAAGLLANGLCLPHSTERKCTVVVEADLHASDILPVLLHELIHVEQFQHFHKCDHDAYFRQRWDELVAAGYRVADSKGLINVAE